jgi:hypothetical protein
LGIPLGRLLLNLFIFFVMIKIASYNLENLFSRPTAMSFTPDTPQGREAIEEGVVPT